MINTPFNDWCDNNPNTARRSVVDIHNHKRMPRFTVYIYPEGKRHNYDSFEQMPDRVRACCMMIDAGDGHVEGLGQKYTSGYIEDYDYKNDLMLRIPAQTTYLIQIPPCLG